MALTARGRASDDDGLARLVLARARAGAGLTVDPATLGAASDRRVVALADQLGAPLVPVIDEVVARADERRELTAAVRRASAEARAVAVGLVAGPPVIGPLTAALVTDDPLAVFATPAGRVVLLAAALLWGAGLLVVTLALRQAARPQPGGDDLLALAATAVRAGEPLPTALRWAAAVASDPGPSSGWRPRRHRDAAALALWLELDGGAAPPAGWAIAGRVLAEASAAGVPVAPLLDELDRVARRAAHAAALERAARLGARLAVPTALLLLPAGLLVAAGPLLLSVLGELR